MPSSKHSEYYHHRDAHIPYPSGSYQHQHRYSGTSSYPTTLSTYTPTSPSTLGSASTSRRSRSHRLPSFGNLPPERIAESTRNCRVVSGWISDGMEYQHENKSTGGRCVRYPSERPSRSHVRGRSRSRRREKSSGCVIL